MSEPPRTASGQALGIRIVRRRVYKRDESGPIARQVYDGQEDVYYDTVINLHELDLLAAKAARNGGLKAKAGPIRVQIVAKKKVEEPHK